MGHVIGVERCRCSSESPDLRATPVRDGSIAINCSCQARTNRRADGPHTRRFGCVMLYRCFVLGLILKTSATSFFALKLVFNWALLRPINKNPFMERIEVLNHVFFSNFKSFPLRHLHLSTLRFPEGCEVTGDSTNHLRIAPEAGPRWGQFDVGTFYL